MPTVIDSLVVRLGLDRSKFDDGARQAKKRLSDLGDDVKKTGKDTDNLTAAFTRLFAVIGGTMAIRNFVAQTIEASAALDRMSKNIGLSVETISSWSRAVEIAGGSADGLQGTIDGLSKAQTDLMLTGQSGLIPYLSALGVSMSDATGKARPVTDLLLDLSDRFAGMDRTTAFNMGRAMGIDPGTMNLLLRGRSEVELMIRRQTEAGAVTKRQAEEASRLRESIVQARQGFEAFGRELLSSALPILEKVGEVFAAIGRWAADNQEFVRAFLAVLAAGLAAVTIAALPLTGTISLVMGLGAAIAALWQDYQVWKRGGESFIDWTKWEPGFRMAGAAIKWLGRLFDDLVFRAVAGGEAIAAAWSRDWDGVKRAVQKMVDGPPAQPPAAPGGSAGGKPATGAGGEQQAVAFFMARGWTREQAIGLAANLKAESNFNPGAVGDSGKAYGIAQWHPDRQAAFKARYGKDIKGSTLDEQMEFVHWELTQGSEKGAGARLRQAQSAGEAAATVSRYYERPAAADAEAAKRAQIAQGMVKGVTGASSLSAGLPAGQVGASSAPVTVTTRIDRIDVTTQATDSKGIARDIGTDLDYALVNQVNYGLM